MLKQYARYGLAVGPLLLLAGLIKYTLDSYWDTVTIVLLAVGGACILAAVVFNLRETRGILERRDTRYGSNTALQILIVVALLVMVNFVTKRPNNPPDTP